MSGLILEFSDIVQKIEEKLNDLNGEEVAEKFNNICDETVEYLGDGQWEVIGSEHTDLKANMIALFPRDYGDS